MIAQLNREYIRARPWKLWPRLTSYLLYEGRPLTTRGQWINPFVLYHLRIEKHLPYGEKVEKPIFITGIGRSGSTMLGTLLSIHPEVGFLNEPKALWHSVIPDEDVIGSYAKGPARFRLTAKDATGQVIRWTNHLYRSYLTISGASRIVDKYPELIFRLPFLLKIFPNAKIIFLTRNGHDVCHSINAWSARNKSHPKGQTHDWWGREKRKWNLFLSELVEKDDYFAPCRHFIQSIDNPLDMAALEWIVSMREGLCMTKTHGRHMYQVRYEDILNAPEQELSAILTFCELARDRKMLSYALKKLRKPAIYRKLPVAPEIEPLFKETMTQLGYLNE